MTSILVWITCSARVYCMCLAALQYTVCLVAQDAFKFFLGASAGVDSWNAESTACTLKLVENPLADFVELPPAYGDLRYSNLICGVIRGALEMVRPFRTPTHTCACHTACVRYLHRT